MTATPKTTGFDAACPFRSQLADRIERGLIEGSLTDAMRRYRDAIDAGLLKIMSKMGISVISSYRGGLNFEAVGLSRAMVAEYFPGMHSRISGIGLHGIEHELPLEDELIGNAYHSGKAQVPTTMSAARERFATSAVTRAALGDEVVDHYVNMADVELAAYRAAFARPEVIHATCEDYRAGATYDLAADVVDHAADRKIACPTLVIASEGSGLASVADTRAWQVRIPRSELLPIAGDSYHVAATEPDRCAQATLAFIRRAGT